MKQRIVNSLLEQVNLEVAALPDAAVRSLLPALKAAEAELTAALRQATAATGAFRRGQLTASLLQVREALAAIDRVHPELLAALHTGNKKAKALAMEHLKKELETFGRLFGGGIPSVNFNAAARLGDKVLLDRFPRSAARWAPRIRKDIRLQLSIATARGETPAEAIKRIRGIITGDPVASLSAVLMKRATYQASRIVRTELINAYNAHALEGIKEAHRDDPRIMKRWDGHVDRRICLDCRGLDGTVVGVREEFPLGVRQPPLHPFCRCAVVPWREDWGEAGPVKRGDIALASTPNTTRGKRNK